MSYPYQPDPAPPPPDPPIQAYGDPVYYAPQPPPPYPYPYGYRPPTPPTDGLAIASLVLSCAAVLGLCTYGAGSLFGLAGAILGHVARSRIRRNGTEGAGLALAGIIVGWVMFAVGIVFAIALIGFFTVHSTVTTE